MPSNTIAFQGLPGAYSDLACRQVFPAMSTLPCKSFEDMFEVVRAGLAHLAMVPIENSLAGRVADIHHLLPDGGLHIIGEHFLPVRHCLLARRGAKLEDLTHATSHVMAVGQCRRRLREMGLTPVIHADTAGAAAEVAARGERHLAALASSLAAEIYGLDIIQEDMQDEAHNTTRFLIMARDALEDHPTDRPLLTSFVFQVRNIPAALYKAMGGFATNGVNMTKLESYMVGGSFSATQFYCDIEGDPRDRHVRLALEELDFFARQVKILGTYPAHPGRKG